MKSYSQIIVIVSFILQKRKMNFTFISGNECKIKTAQNILGKDTFNITRIDLQEIQSLDVEEVAREKAKTAYDILRQPVLVDDTALYIDNMNGFPGAFVKFYYTTIGLDGMIKHHEGSKCFGKTVLVYYDGKEMNVYEGIVHGKIASEIHYGSDNHGWDPIFIPDGYSVPLTKLDDDVKATLHNRFIAFEKLKNDKKIKVDET